ncbi:hypothetical protein PTKIN_Ptkin09bG0025900 [Pterospermum kingtungense]
MEQKRIKEEREEREINELMFSIMEGYSDKVIAPLSQFNPPLMMDATAVEAKGSSSRKRPVAQVTDQSLKKERGRRRNKMAESYDFLLSMVPNIFPKASRANIVAETIAYIQSLEKEITRLEQLKSSYESSKAAKGKMHLYSNKSSSINVTVSNNNIAFFGIQSLVRPSLVTDIFMVFHKHKAEVLAANVAVNQRQLTVTVTAAVVDGNADSAIEKIKRDILTL